MDRSASPSTPVVCLTTPLLGQPANVDAQLQRLQQTLGKHMPICDAMQITARGWNNRCLAMGMPLGPNKNHQYSAFAGSLSALCTITGWGEVFMLLQNRGLEGNVVIRRSAIRYLKPVRSEQIVAQCRPLESEQVEYFFELLEGKGRSKIDVAVEIPHRDEPFVVFSGSYVVQDCQPLATDDRPAGE